MNAGRLTKRVVVERPIVTRSSDSGDELIAWEYFGTFYAEVGPLRGRELFSEDQIQSETDTKICLRYSKQTSKIDAKWRMRFKDTVYNIQHDGINVDMANDELQFMCKSGRNQG